MSVHRRPQISRQLLEGAIDAVEVGEGEAIRHSVVFSGMSVRGVGFIAMPRRSHSVSPVSRKEPCRINRSMSASVQVFGRRHDEPFRALWRPASKKREGTKSREVWHWRCCGRYGDLIAAPGWRVDVTPTGCGRRISPLARLEAYNRHLSKRLKRIKERTARRPQ